MGFSIRQAVKNSNKLSKDNILKVGTKTQSAINFASSSST